MAAVRRDRLLGRRMDETVWIFADRKIALWVLGVA